MAGVDNRPARPVSLVDVARPSPGPRIVTGRVSAANPRKDPSNDSLTRPPLPVPDHAPHGRAPPNPRHRPAPRLRALYRRRRAATL